MSKDFAGHLAVVTGGASGIGEQVCRDLAAEGASVVVLDRNETAATKLAASLPTGDGRQHLGIRVDVSKKADVDAAVAQVTKTYGRPADLIVNSAGIADGQEPLEDIKEEYFDSVCSGVVELGQHGALLRLQGGRDAVQQSCRQRMGSERNPGELCSSWTYGNTSYHGHDRWDHMERLRANCFVEKGWSAEGCVQRNFVPSI